MSNSPSPIPGLPGDAEGPVFAAPWQARAFALLASFQAREGFPWADWVAVFSAQRAADEARQDDPGYYHSWVTALEKLLEQGGWNSRNEFEAALTDTRENWPHPAHFANREPVARDPARR
ncbi:nitrile hydratase accessory protein [Rhizobiaceae sp. 2RAB30]